MRPVSTAYEINQPFGSYATGGVSPSEFGTEVEQLVFQYGNYQPSGHAGCDIACPIGTPVHAIAAGTVLWADWGTNLPGDDSWGPSGYFRRWALYKTFPGIVTVIQHDGWIGVYAHLSDAPLNPGDVVTEGQVIALSGNTRSPGVTLGAHLHVEALVDLNYPTGGGLIYGRTDPTPYFGGIAAMGTITPQSSEEDFLATLSDAEKDTLFQVLDNIHTKSNQLPGAGYWEDLIQATARVDRGVGQLPAAVLNQSFKLADGTVTNLAGILTAIHAQPVTGSAVVSDPQAVVRALAAQLTK